MELIKHVKIVGFRSIVAEELVTLGHLVVLVGKNSSGKSNILRALNLFFNDEVQPGQRLVFARDLFEQPRHRKKKRISVTVEFELPSSFNLRNQLEHLKVLGRQFSITRIWELDAQRNIGSKYVVEVTGKLIANPADIARQFLTLINFRYIPNRTVPTDILRDESQSLAGSVFLRMKDQSHVNAMMNELTAAAGRMLKDASESMRDVGSPLRDPTVATRLPNQMVLMSGFQALGSHGGIIQDAEWGAGHQAFFLYQILRTLDTDYSRHFGWRQATIWAVEEPESALHRDLETALAAQFRAWTQDAKYRLQILLTTHSSVFTMAADVGSWVCLENSSTKMRVMPIQRLARAAETEGVAAWTHPILSHPWNPIVLVEGPTDAEVLSHVALLAGYDRLRFLSLPTLDSTEPGGGKDTIISYLKRHQALIQNRQIESPLIVLFDWEISRTELNKARNAYGPGGEDHVLRMNAAHCDSQMSPDFKGIERFYPPHILRESHSAGELILGIAASKPYSIGKSQLDPAKHMLLKRFKQVLDPSDLIPLVRVLDEIELAVSSSTKTQRNLFEQNHSTP